MIGYRRSIVNSVPRIKPSRRSNNGISGSVTLGRDGPYPIDTTSEQRLGVRNVQRQIVSQIHDIAESIDRLVTVDMCPPHLPRGSLAPLYEAALQQVGKPLSLAAAEALADVCAADRWVVIATGFVLNPYMPVGESDGPIGAVALARSLNRAFGAKVMILAEEECIQPIRAVCLGAGLLPLEPDEAHEVSQSLSLSPFPVDPGEAEQGAKRILRELDPVAMVALEKVGRNEKGVYHTSPGGDMSPWTAKVDILFEMMRATGRPTIGIGDYGNEMGLGSLIETVKRIAPTARRCACPCGAGIATTVEADVPFVAAISNWGAYGICACLAAMLGDRQILHDAATERRMVEQASLAGLCDGTTVKPSFSADGVSLEGQVAVNTLLHEIIRTKTEEVAFVRN